MQKDDLDLAFDAAVTEVEATEPDDKALDAAILGAEQAVDTTQPVADDYKVDATGRVHAKDGKFAPKPGETSAEPAPSTEPAAAQPVTEAATAATSFQPHTHWAPELKAVFADLSPAAQKALLDREADMDKGRTEWAGKAEDYNRINKVIAPHMTSWQREGVTPDVAIGRLLAAQQAIEANPIEGFTYLLQRFGRGNEADVLAQLASQYGLALVEGDNQGTQQHEGYQPAQAAPTAHQIEALVQERVTNALQSREAEAQQANLLKEIEAVRTSPKNLYFENVKVKVAALAQQAWDSGDRRPYREMVQDAYDQAVWADPTTRPLLMQAEQKQRDEAARAAAAAKVEAAKKASVSITGSPQAPPARAQSTNRNLDAEIDAAINAAYAGDRA